MFWKEMTTLELWENFYTEFRKEPLWEAMAETVENSPWHREANVAVHTAALITWYKTHLLQERSAVQAILTLTACLFHDTAKPQCKVKKYSEERGDYFAFHGHELVSARLWVDWIITHPETRINLGLSLEDVTFIALMIEHHVPFAMTSRTKLQALKRAFMLQGGSSGHQAWIDLLLSDQHGRISDDHSAKLARVEDWLSIWEAVYV